MSLRGSNAGVISPRRTRHDTRELNVRTESELESALARVVGELREGLLHGFFDYSMSCEVVRGGKRRFTLRAGKSHRFVISEDELD